MQRDLCSRSAKRHPVIRNMRHAAKLGNHHPEKDRQQDRISAKEQERRLHRPRLTIVLLRPGRAADLRSAKIQEVMPLMRLNLRALYSVSTSLYYLSLRSVRMSAGVSSSSGAGWFGFGASMPARPASLPSSPPE